jgi:pimeloyl-ACP methyl ester carboxylesterase
MDPSIDTLRVTTAIGDLHVERRGAGPAVLCWPSLYCDARTLDPVVEDLARDHEVLVLDGPGHGRSGTPDRSFSLADCADAAILALDALRINRVVWLGAAWGGHVGITAARRFPGRLAGLVVLNAPMAPWRGRRLALMRLTYALLWLFGPRSFVSRLVADKMIAPNAGPDRKALVDIVASSMRRCDTRGLLLAARSAMFDRGDLAPLLRDVHVPVLFVAGSRDTLFSVEEARQQAAMIPECRVLVVEQSSHQSALEAPDQILPAIRDALARWSHGQGEARGPVSRQETPVG